MTHESHPIRNQSGLTVVEARSAGFDLSAASELTGLDQEFILEIVGARLAPAVNPQPVLDERGICRLRQIAELRDHRHLNLRTVKLTLDLMDRLEAAEEELRVLGERAFVGVE